MIELIDYYLMDHGSGHDLQGCNLSLSQGDVCAIQTDSHADAHAFLKALATLVSPLRGEYRLMGQRLDFSDYRELLPFKKRIGYIGSDAAMISNFTIRDNLLLMRQYDENDLDVEIDGDTAELIRLFEFGDKLEMKPGGLTPPILRLAIAVRELSKSPALLLLEYPEDYIGLAKLRVFTRVLSRMPLSEMVVVFVSEDKDLVKQFANTHVAISRGSLAKD